MSEPSVDTLIVDFDGRVPYDRYVEATTLHSLQRPRTDDPGEMSFLVVSQIMELYFRLIDSELREAQRQLRAGEIWSSLAPLRRAALHLEGLDASWQSLRWMTPADFNRFRAQLGDASGMQSAMYRRLEFRLGLRTASLIRLFKRDVATHRELLRSLEEPSIWDDTVAVLAAHGHEIPRAVLDRDFTLEHVPHPAVEAAWVAIYSDDGPDNHLRMLGEALAEVAERFGEWRYHHLSAVRRAMGAKPGTGGSSGIGWLERSLARAVFPELWSARTHM
ncbi:tryptophan 2,3-dioxygenase [Amycolatopsis taiwanensis]|uniref:tryptophan 2,3-dioxygenase n=1 Tax=Amycolatopsis taiwanensis TaxID=342230 RepID=UPI00048321A8|nr:tryptophan 2,3-dioxygenase family protein [Amycolatopsis taiwanensis]